jgi:hypothetical protein
MFYTVDIFEKNWKFLNFSPIEIRYKPVKIDPLKYFFFGKRCAHNQYRFFCDITGDSFLVTIIVRIIEKMDNITAVRKIMSYEKPDG